MKSPEGTCLTCSESRATQYAKILIGCYRRGDAEDGPTYIRAVVIILMRYHEDVVRMATDPRIGLPAKAQFLPTIFEVRSECERIVGKMRADADRKAHESLGISRREYTPEESARRKSFIAEWRQKHAEMRVESALIEGDFRLTDLDARHCKGTMRERVQEAHKANLERLRADCAANPPMASARLLATALARAQIPAESPTDSDFRD